MKISTILILACLTCFSCAGTSLSMQPVRECGAKDLPDHAKNKMGGSGVIAQEWINQDTLSVSTYLYAICAGTTISGKYQVDANKITITYSERLGSSPTKCRCARQYNHKISGLKKQDYKIMVVETE